MITIGGELAIKVDRVSFSEDIKAPFGVTHNAACIDMTLHSQKDHLHICGDNDWAYLLVEALLPLLRYAEETILEIEKRLNDYNGKPEVIILGKNEYRAVDILHRLRGCGNPLQIYKGIPIIRGNNISKIELLGNYNLDEVLPFF